MLSLFPHSYCVIPGILYAGESPLKENDELSLSRLYRMQQFGIRYCISLTEDIAFDQRTLQELALSFTDIHIQVFPIEDFSTPKPELMLEIIQSIHESVKARIPVYVSCIMGNGRTGTVIGCFLQEYLGISGNQSLDMLSDLRSHSGNWGNMSSPETKEQRDFVMQWKELQQIQTIL